MREQPRERTVRKASSRRWKALAMVAFCLLASACGDDTTPEVAEAPPTTEAATTTTETEATTITSTEVVETDDETEDAAVEASLIAFESCGGGAECAMVDVPLDYSEPDGETTQIHVTLHPAKGDRIGTLFLNPGGPGGPVEDMVKGIGQWGPPPITERFDLVGIDPRGTGKSGLVDCNSNWLEDSTQLLTVEDGLADDLDAFVADFSGMAAECEDEVGVEVLASLTTENAARDIEFVRVALGGEQLNYVGYSYGTAIGSVYATLFPDTIRSMILDGAVPTNPSEGDIEAQGARLEATFVRLDKACERWSACPIADIGLLNAIDQVRTKLETNGEIGPLRPHTFERAVGIMVGIAPAMQDVAEGLALALEGNGQMLHGMGSDFLTPIPSGGFQEFGGAFPAIVCADGWNMAASTTSELLGQAERTAAALPNIGPGWEVPCDLWPVSGSGIAPVNYTGATSILVVGNTDDPITPLEFGEDLVGELGNATLLTWVGSDHTVVLNGADRCIDDHAVAYLIDGVMPAEGTVCEMRGLVGVGYDGSPVVVNRITPGSAAEDAGLAVGDVVLKVDGTDIETAEDWDEINGPPETDIVVLVERDGEEIELEMTRGFPVWELWRADE